MASPRQGEGAADRQNRVARRICQTAGRGGNRSQAIVTQAKEVDAEDRKQLKLNHNIPPSDIGFRPQSPQSGRSVQFVKEVPAKHLHLSTPRTGGGSHRPIILIAIHMGWRSGGRLNGRGTSLEFIGRWHPTLPGNETLAVPEMSGGIATRLAE